MSEKNPPSQRTRVKRYAWLADYDRATLEGIVDAQPLGHVGCVFDGVPFVTPTFIWREGDRVYWHGAAAGRMFKALPHQDVCLTVSLLDGLVMARAAFNFNCNFRSAMIVGRAELVDDAAEKERLLRAFVNGLVPGQWERLRPVTPREIAATAVASLSLAEASCKVRTGPPIDDDEDYAHPVWAGVVPIRQQVLAPEPDPRNAPGVEMPPEVLSFRLG